MFNSTRFNPTPSDSSQFNPTHLLVSRAKKTPVQLIPSATGFKALTELEWQNSREPAFELRSRQGWFCQGVAVIGFKLEPIAIEALNFPEEQSVSPAQ
jgi:hypothetical protein